MKQTIALALLFVAMVAGLTAWHAFSLTSDTAVNLPPEASAAAPTLAQAGAIVAQVSEKMIPKGPLAPEIASQTWFNSPALSTQDLRGHVIVVEFWTFG